MPVPIKKMNRNEFENEIEMEKGALGSYFRLKTRLTCDFIHDEADDI
ncbi:hypothetical protein GCM10010917_39460 [Paenibacillus physcomitrellae]|uniref:Uncharacterized protein n=1 Tax=Paenibacillus physcomitrellae TaxID=1619311 RepID=A0ABQ1GUG5_9BACL|nr:hypothetical protein GCM10010917_39460 [Paenibacillus physcomitrellae]